MTTTFNSSFVESKHIDNFIKIYQDSPHILSIRAVAELEHDINFLTLTVVIYYARNRIDEREALNGILIHRPFEWIHKSYASTKQGLDKAILTVLESMKDVLEYEMQRIFQDFLIDINPEQHKSYMDYINHLVRNER